MKTQLLLKIPALLLTFILFSGCLKVVLTDNCECLPKTGQTCVVYNSTNCNDSWGYEDSREKTGRMIRNYFAAKDIQLYSIGFDENGHGENCYSCSCHSGLRICAQVDDEEVIEMLQQGFQLY